jgi:hypothetical protein
VYNGDNFIEDSPRPLTDYGLPPQLDKIDAVMVWSKNGKTFLYRSVLDMVFDNEPQTHSKVHWKGGVPNEKEYCCSISISKYKHLKIK